MEKEEGIGVETEGVRKEKTGEKEEGKTDMKSEDEERRNRRRGRMGRDAEGGKDGGGVERDETGTEGAEEGDEDC